MRRRGLSGITGLVLTAIILSSFPTAASATYKIKQGDTLSAVAHRNHTTVAKLCKANHLKETSVLALGKALTIPGQKAAAHPKNAHAKRVMAKAAPQKSYAVHVSAGSASLRGAPKSNSHRIALLSTGATMKVLAKQDKWAKVALPNGVCGYIYRPLLAKGAGSKPAVASVQKSKPAPVAKAAPQQPDRSSNGLVRMAMAYRGTRYSRGGTSRSGFDCSGFTRYIYAKCGVSLPHSSAAQAGRGVPVDRGDLKQGDLVFFSTYRRGISHVGIYIGNGNFVHASNHGRGVTVDSLSSSYYAPRYRGARRVD